MQIQIHSNGIANSDAINDRLRQEVEAALKVFADQVTRVEAHLHDDNGPKHGQDKRCWLAITRWRWRRLTATCTRPSRWPRARPNEPCATSSSGTRPISHRTSW